MEKLLGMKWRRQIRNFIGGKNEDLKTEVEMVTVGWSVGQVELKNQRCKEPGLHSDAVACIIINELCITIITSNPIEEYNLISLRQKCYW